MTPWLSFLGMARKAGAVVIGEDAAAQAVLDHKARLILLANDAGDTTAQRVKRLESDKTPVLTLPEGKEEVGGIVGFAAVAVVTVTDLGFASALVEKLAAQNEGYQALAESMKQRKNKAVRRKADTAKYGKKSKRRKA